MLRRFALSALCCVVLPCAGLAATYSPVSQRLEASTWQTTGPDNILNLGTDVGGHQVNSAYTYQDPNGPISVTSVSSTNLADTSISVNLGTTTSEVYPRWAYAAASAQVVFSVPDGRTFQISATSSSYPNWYWSLSGPGTWQWSGHNGDVVAIPGGLYTLTTSASIARLAGTNQAGSGSITITVAPEPSSAMLLSLGAVLLLRRRARGRS